MSAQTAYSLAQAIAVAGLIYAQHPHQIDSRSAESGPIAIGIAVSRGTDKDKQCVKGGTAFLGISVRALDQEGAANTGAIAWETTETVPILRDGYIWAVCSDGCVPGNAVNYVNATGVLGAGAAVAGETNLLGGTWETTASAGGLAVLRLNSTLTSAGA